jgi:hypothetical protein
MICSVLVVRAPPLLRIAAAFLALGFCGPAVADCLAPLPETLDGPPNPPYGGLTATTGSMKERCDLHRRSSLHCRAEEAS